MDEIAPKKVQHSWTEEETATLERMWGEGMSASEIASVLGRSRDSVIGKWWRLGLSEDQRDPVHLLDAEGDHCRYPLWADEGPYKSSELKVCGLKGYPWCPKHKAIVFQKQSQRRKRDEGIIEAERASGTKRIFG